MAKPGSWDCIELTLEELGGHTFDSITERYRKGNPVCLLTPLQHLDGYTALNIFAPKDSAFWAAASDSVFPACRETLLHMAGDASARTEFMKDLRKAKIRKSAPQIRLLWQFAGILEVSGGRVPSLSVGREFAENWRHWSAGFPSARTEVVLARMEEEAAQFGEYAFFGIDEAVLLADPAGRRSLGAYLFHNIDYRFYRTRPERDSFKQEVLAELRRAVHRMESGQGFDSPMEPIWMIKGLPKFWLAPGIGENPPEYDDAVAHEILSYRARLVRLLGWPNQYQAVVREFAEFTKQKAEFGSGRFEPYDVEHELSSYLDEMRLRYPVLTRQPDFG